MKQLHLASVFLIVTAMTSSFVDSSDVIKCQEVGFFRHPKDCAKFYRCVDFGYRVLSVFHFDCPAGTVFDEALSVCNWPYAAQPPCPEPETEPEMTTEEPETDQETTPAETTPDPEVTSAAPEEEVTTKPEVDQDDYDEDDTVVVSPTFSFQCQSAGVFPHEHDCQKFWLCKPQAASGAELYRCPEGFLFHDEIRRCQKAELVPECDKQPEVTGRVSLEPPAITLRVSELQSFFERYSF